LKYYVCNYLFSNNRFLRKGVSLIGGLEAKLQMEVFDGNKSNKNTQKDEISLANQHNYKI